jgi:hypothetical protein
LKPDSGKKYLDVRMIEEYFSRRNSAIYLLLPLLGQLNEELHNGLDIYL